MPNGRDYTYTKEYGPHEYPDAPHGTSDCKFKCGCWAGPSNSGGPLGLDPLCGECPGNPKNGMRLEGNADYMIAVTRRIRKLESENYRLEQELIKLEEIKNTPKAKLAERVKQLENQIRAFKEFVELIDNKAPRL